MKHFLRTMLLFCFAGFVNTNIFAAADITLSSVAVPAGNMNQGSVNNVIYIGKMVVATEGISITSINVTLDGDYNNTDLGNISVFYNLTAPDLASASLGSYTPGSFAGPHLFSIPAARSFTAGTTVYIIITARINNTAGDNHTVSVNGAAHPLTISAGIAPNITNNQTDVAGVQTIQAADITFTSVAVPAGNMNQGSNSNIIYIVKMDVGTEPVTVSNVVFNLKGTYSNTDLGNISIFYNLTAPNLATASLGNSVPGNFASPHLFSIPVSRAFAANSSVYILITANIVNTAADNHTLFIDGAADPLTITTSTAPNFTDNQTNAAGVQTIQAADITFTSIAVPAGNMNQGSSGNIIYIVKMDVGTEPVTVSNVVFTLNGTYSNTDLGNISMFYNLTAPNLATASLGNTVPGNFAAPHLFSIPTSRAFAANSSVYILITTSIASTATDGHTLFIDGAASPLGITSTTVPNFTDNQTNAAGVQTIQAADISISTVATAAGSLNPGTNTNIIYIAKMNIGTEPVTLTNVLFTLNGTYDNDDLGNISVFYNLTAPNLAAASLGGTVSGTFAGPHAFTIPASRPFSAGSTVYILITANVANTATDNHTLFINGSTSQLSITTTTTPNITNNQADVAGLQTIQTSDIILSTVNLPAGNIIPGTNSNIIYALKVDVGTQSVILNNVQVNLGGDYDNDDLGNLGIYFSATAPNLGNASQLNHEAINVAGPHTFSIPASRTIAAGTTGYILFTADVSSSATLNHTVAIDGAANPVVLGFTTTPNVTNNQRNSAGVFNITNATLPLTLTAFTASSTSTHQVQLQWITAAEVNTKAFEIQWSSDGSTFRILAGVTARGNSAVDTRYSFIHAVR